MKARKLAAAAVTLAVLVSGCGYSEDEWKAQLDKYAQLQQKHEATEKDLEAARRRVEELTKELEAAGVDMTKLKERTQSLSASLEERERALAEYKARAKQLEAIKARFEMLKRKLDALTKLGLAVNIRRNRMVISLPGDVLFDSGKETLKGEGKEILGKVANVIKADQTLLQRDYQVSGHTDSKPYAGVFRDNWGLSLMRSREVLMFLVNANTGGLPPAHWSAAGFADTDPVAPNDTDEGRQKNRRCDLIVVPSVEEMLDLKAITQ